MPHGAPLARWSPNRPPRASALSSRNPSLAGSGAMSGPPGRKGFADPASPVDTIRSGAMADEERTGSGTDRPGPGGGGERPPRGPAGTVPSRRPPGIGPPCPGPRPGHRAGAGRPRPATAGRNAPRRGSARYRHPGQGTARRPARSPATSARARRTHPGSPRPGHAPRPAWTRPAPRPADQPGPGHHPKLPAARRSAARREPDPPARPPRPESPAPPVLRQIRTCADQSRQDEHPAREPKSHPTRTAFTRPGPATPVPRS